MNLLLDTHAFLWFMEGSEQLSERARLEIEAKTGRSLLSAARGATVPGKLPRLLCELRSFTETVDRER
jgi:hypothetical protein